MDGISLASEKLLKRRLSVQKLFKPLVPRNHVRVFLRSGSENVLLGLGQDNFGTSLRSARHPSRVESLFLNYFEIWRSEKGGALFTLERAYLHLDAPYPDGTGDEEVLALHCDPAIDRSTPSFTYKRGPHLHVSGNKRDISKAHIALCLNDLQKTCSDVNAFSAALTLIAGMINDELLPHLA
jgi:hypothetical protein